MTARYFVTDGFSSFSEGEKSPRRARQTKWEAWKEAREMWKARMGAVIPRIHAVDRGIILAVDRFAPTDDDLVWLVERKLSRSPAMEDFEAFTGIKINEGEEE